MDTSNNQQDSFAERKHQSIYNLERSRFPEEKELAKKSKLVIEELVKTLKPIIKYVEKPFLFVGGKSSKCEYPTTIRAVRIGPNQDKPYDTAELFLHYNGILLVARRCEESGKTLHFHFRYSSMTTDYEFWPIEFIVESLGKVLAEAKEKREKHLASIAERSAKLDKVLEILKS